MQVMVQSAGTVRKQSFYGRNEVVKVMDSWCKALAQSESRVLQSNQAADDGGAGCVSA